MKKTPCTSIYGRHRWQHTPMMMMTICFNQATRLLEISRSRWREEEQTRTKTTQKDKYGKKYANTNENTNANTNTNAMCNVQWKCAMCNEKVQCAMKMYNVQWKCTITISMTIQHFNTITGFACISIRPLGSTGCPCVYNIAQGTYRLYMSLGPYRIFMHLYAPRAI